MAKRFQFRMEQVLRLRKQVEEMKVRELEAAKNRLWEVERVLEEHREKQHEFLGACGELEKGEFFTAEQIMTYCDYQESLSREEKEFVKRKEDWMLEVERRRRAAVQVSRERQLMENLKDQKKREYLQEVQNEEQKFLDEVSSIAFVRRERAKKTMVVNE